MEPEVSQEVQHTFSRVWRPSLLLSSLSSIYTGMNLTLVRANARVLLSMQGLSRLVVVMACFMCLLLYCC